MARNSAHIADTIVDAAIERAETVGWDAVRLSDVARDLGLPVPEVVRHFRDLDQVADAWFGRAMAAMLAEGERVAAQPPRDRVEALLLAWFGALSPHRAVTAQMIAAKMWPFHPHHWVPMIFSLSRTIQWLRDAAGLSAQGRQRQIEEIALSALFVAALRLWCRDGSDERMRRALARGLDRLEPLLSRNNPG